MSTTPEARPVWLTPDDEKALLEILADARSDVTVVWCQRMLREYREAPADPVEAVLEVLDVPLSSTNISAVYRALGYPGGPPRPNQPQETP